MAILLVDLVVSFGLCVILTPIVRSVAARCGLVDRPDRRRKLHQSSIPVAGGVAVFLSICLAIGAMCLVPNPLQGELTDDRQVLAGLLLAALTICVVGVADDYWALRGRHKLLGQLVACAIVMGSGVVVQNIRLFEWEVELGLLALPFTLFWLLGAINALNLIDGLDGLSSSVGLIVSLTLAAMAGMTGHWSAACVALALAGSLIGFLVFNFPPASIFLGDSGSMLIGLVVGVLGIHSSLKAPATIALAAPVATLTIPILDTLAAIVRRKLTGQSIYCTDRGHLHHCLLRRGFSNRRVLILVSFFCLATGSGALASLALRNEFYAMFSALAVVGTLILTRLFGYVEFSLLKNRVLATVASFLQGSGAGKAHESTIRLPGSGDWREFWGSLTQRADRMNLQAIHLDVDVAALDEGYHARWDRPNIHEPESARWRAEIPLMAHGQPVGRIEIIGSRDDEPVWRKIATLWQSLERFESAVAVLGAAGVTQDAATPNAEPVVVAADQVTATC